MRNSTKLKEILKDHEVNVSITGTGTWEMIISSKEDLTSYLVNGKNWSELLNKAYSESRKRPKSQ